LLLAARQTSQDCPADLQGDAAGDDRHDANAREYLYEKIPATEVRRLQVDGLQVNNSLLTVVL
jgi:hypothetical protein